MEVVSPRLDTTQHITSTLSDFWEAMRVHFNPQKDLSCGGHVHVTPLSLNNKFSFRTLKKIAFATVVYEEFVASILPQARRENKYCQANSQSVDSGLRETLLWGKSYQTLQRVAAEIKSQPNETELYFYMQGNRYVLWNFQNIFPNPRTGRCTGTVEFRGGNQFLNTKGTLAWVAFVLGFITLAMQEVRYIHYLSLQKRNVTNKYAGLAQQLHTNFVGRAVGSQVPEERRRLVEAHPEGLEKVSNEPPPAGGAPQDEVQVDMESIPTNCLHRHLHRDRRFNICLFVLLGEGWSLHRAEFWANTFSALALAYITFHVCISGSHIGITHWNQQDGQDNSALRHQRQRGT